GGSPSTGGFGGTPTGGAPATGGSGGSPPGTGGVVSTGGTPGTGGMNTGGMGGGACTNVRPTGTNWDEATCDQWASETSECEAAWMIDNGYCDESCGRCSNTGTGGAAGRGGTAGSGGAAGRRGTAGGGGTAGSGGRTTPPKVGGDNATNKQANNPALDLAHYTGPTRPE